jgi:hypothetical protein
MTPDTAVNPCKEDRVRRDRAAAGDTLTEKLGNGMERRITFRVGYDHREHPQACGGGGHGQHGMEIAFALCGPHGSVVWSFSLPEFVPGNINDIGNIPIRHRALDAGYAQAIDVHAVHPYSEDDTPQWGPGECKLVPPGQPCYFDVSYLAAGDVLGEFLLHGPMTVWATLAQWYEDIAKRPEP